MLQHFEPGDFLIFQLESGYGLLRVLAVDDVSGDPVWHVSAYRDLFLDSESADQAIADASSLSVSHPHMALTNRAFESTQVARMTTAPLTESDLAPLQQWRSAGDQEISDRSVRLLLGLR